MHRVAAIDHRIAVGTEGIAQAQGRVKLGSVLVEQNHTQAVGALDRPAVGGDFSRQQANQGRFPAAVRADQTQPCSGGKRQGQRPEQRFATQRFGQVFGRKQFARLATRSREINARRSALSVAELQLGQVADHLFRPAECAPAPSLSAPAGRAGATQSRA